MGKWCLLTSRKLVSTSLTKSVRRPEWFFSLRLRVQSDASHWTRRVVYTANTSWCPTHIFSWARDCAFRVLRSSCLVWKARVILLSRTHFVYDAGAQHPACSFSVTTPVVALTPFVSVQLQETQCCKFEQTRTCDRCNFEFPLVSTSAPKCLLFFTAGVFRFLTFCH